MVVKVTFVLMFKEDFKVDQMWKRLYESRNYVVWKLGHFAYTNIIFSFKTWSLDLFVISLLSFVVSCIYFLICQASTLESLSSRYMWWRCLWVRVFPVPLCCVVCAVVVSLTTFQVSSFGAGSTWGHSARIGPTVPLLAQRAGRAGVCWSLRVPQLSRCMCSLLCVSLFSIFRVVPLGQVQWNLSQRPCFILHSLFVYIFVETFILCFCCR